MGLAFVAVGHEGHGGDHHGDGAAAYHGIHGRAIGAAVAADIAHRNGLVDAGCQQAAGDFANGLAIKRLQNGVITNRHPLGRHQANAAALDWNGTVELTQDHVRAEEAACTLRFSLSRLNTRDEVLAAADTVLQAARHLAEQKNLFVL